MLRLKEIRKSKGMTQQQVADALGLHLTNYNKLETGATEMTLTRLEQLSQILHVAPTEFISLHSNTRTVQIKQHIQAGVWSESFVWPEDAWYEVAIPDDEQFRNVNLYGAELRGPSMNKRYQDGSAIIYTSMIETGEQPAFGKRYIVEIERADGLREATIKTLWKDETGKPWLLPESNDPRHQAPIDLTGAEGDTIRIVGRVAYSVQRED
ncbi:MULTISPECIES: XRE family transcriptional regulator [unclassified Rhizobium]|uniref:XRE family transcriptional regulator n=1 Tax=unclassified Rhizobium TaxID=2613769 RepID=UPI001ADD0EC8|nr:MULTISPECIES: XRE family transcriptional regulator [unclassified Rhizobium]MBO9125484.1 LexA family transcriptional regulator [Rhizobium sp. 16-488-2b]MBO9176069.1 LexA family transcriptional regulator [Rhizobium sp. 16-488-2a]